MAQTRLTKSSSDKMVAGVCGGLARYLDIDATWIRLGFVLLSFGGGAGIIIYIAMAIIVPADTIAPTSDEDGEPPTAIPSEEARQNDQRRRYTVGIILVALGGFFLAQTLGLLWWFRWDILWPAVLIAFGIFIIVRRQRST